MARNRQIELVPARATLEPTFCVSQFGLVVPAPGFVRVNTLLRGYIFVLKIACLQNVEVGPSSSQIIIIFTVYIST